MKPIKQQLLVGITTMLTGFSLPLKADIDLSQVPLFLTQNGKPNILMMLGNANSMDSDASGAGVGSASPESKSEIARNAIKKLIDGNMYKLNMGLLAYQQNRASLYYLSTSAQDASYNPADYDPNFNGPRNSQTKKFRIANPTDPGNYIYYNVAAGLYVPSYSPSFFCYSSTACTSPSHDFRGVSQNGYGCNVFEDETTGPWDYYACYGKKTGTSNSGTSGMSSSRGTFYFYAGTNELARGITDFGKHLAAIYIGRAWTNATSPGAGFLHVPIAELDENQATKLNYKLATSDPNIHQYKPVDPLRPLQNHGLQPLEGTILTANNYFNNNGLPSNQRSGADVDIPQTCAENYMVMVTDALPSVTKDGSPSADVVANLNAVATQTSQLLNSPANVKSYVVGFALPYGVNPEQLNVIAQAGGTNTAYYADDPESLDTAFSSILQNIAAQVEGAGASVAANSSALQTDSSVFQSKFDSSDWSGQLFNIALGNDGDFGATLWEAGEKLDAKNANDRIILSYKPSNNKGITFRWPADENNPSITELDNNQITALNKNSTGLVDGYGAERLGYLRGETTNQGSNGLNFRNRTTKLGDIVNSAPMYVGAPVLNISDRSYLAFKASKRNRTPMVYVGANDGMLHGFNAQNGQELLAYVPAVLYEQLPQLTASDYAHRFYVDSSPNVSDVKFSNGNWRSMLVSGMGHGAKGFFALDVTNPNNFQENKANNIVRYEFPKANTNATQSVEVGHISGPIPIAKLNTGQYAAIFGNGLNAGGSGKASLFIVNIQNGNIIKRISTGAGNGANPNALMNPVLVDVDGNQTADYAYAGDIQGNVWKFDLSTTNKGGWKKQYKLIATGQPITQMPNVSKHPLGGYMVYFGTGKYLETSDITSTASNHFYGIWDHFNAGVTISDLVKQEVSETKSISGDIYRKVTKNLVDYENTPQKKGWYLPLPTTGERAVSNPTVRGGKVIFTTMIPTTQGCGSGGTSWLMELDYLSGGMLDFAALDTDNNATIDSNDEIVAGLKSGAINYAPTIIRGQPTSDGPGGGNPTVKEEYKYLNQSGGNVIKVKESASGGQSRRSSWRQILTE